MYKEHNYIKVLAYLGGFTDNTGTQYRPTRVYSYIIPS